MLSLTEHLLNQTESLIVVLDKKNHAEYVSASVMHVLGFDCEELLGEGWIKHTRSTDNDRMQFIEKLSSIRAGKNNYGTEERLLSTASGGEKWILWNVSALEEGRVIGIGHDITDRKRQQKILEARTRELQERNIEITDSMKYAQRIQESILPEESMLKKSFADSFVLYKPKDIVSGDFWWYYKKANSVFLALADCTGHGVPGALMSVMAHSLFKEVFLNRKINDPGELLHEIDKELFATLNRNHAADPYKDGMDVALCKYDFEKAIMYFSGALRPLLIVRNGNILEIPACRYPVGFYDNANKKFVTHEIKLEKGDCCYIFSDGYSDQFGGEKGKKLNKPKFRELILSMNDMPMEEQCKFLEYAHHNWRQQESQTDDITIIGLRV